MMSSFGYILQLLNDQLWEAPSYHGLHQCVEPTSKYKGSFLLSNWFVVVFTF